MTTAIVVRTPGASYIGGVLALRDYANAVNGHTPPARQCADKIDLAFWFVCFARVCRVSAETWHL